MKKNKEDLYKNLIAFVGISIVIIFLSFAELIPFTTVAEPIDNTAMQIAKECVIAEMGGEINITFRTLSQPTIGAYLVIRVINSTGNIQKFPQPGLDNVYYEVDENGTIINKNVRNWWVAVHKSGVLVGGDCGSVAPEGRDECCQARGWGEWTGETCTNQPPLCMVFNRYPTITQIYGEEYGKLSKDIFDRIEGPQPDIYPNVVSIFVRMKKCVPVSKYLICVPETPCCGEIVRPEVYPIDSIATITEMPKYEQLYYQFKEPDEIYLKATPDQIRQLIKLDDVYYMGIGIKPQRQINYLFIVGGMLITGVVIFGKDAIKLVKKKKVDKKGKK